MIYKKLAALAAWTLLGAVLIAAPAEARFGGGGFGGGGFGGGGFRGASIGAGGFRGGFVRGPGFGGGFVRGPAFVGRPGFINRGFFPGRRFAFFPHRRFFGGPFFGVGAFALAGSSCWTWVPTAFGWQRVWACDPGWGGWGWGY
ncbi:MAG TPA: hypothetical protein VKW08_24005 [Xanthobacteraceae bacterium]|nr:hypothetical protein [Xanthobacteraceae bacterium]